MQIPPHLDLSDVCWAIDLQEIKTSEQFAPEDAVDFNEVEYETLLARLNDSSNTVNAQYTRGEARVIFTLQVSRVARSEGDMYDIIIQRMTSKTPRCGHGTQAVLALLFIAAKMNPARGVHLQSTITEGSKALGEKLKRDHGFTSDTQKCNYLSPLVGTCSAALLLDDGRVEHKLTEGC